MADRPSLGELERQAENRPERIDVLALCEYLDSDDHEHKRSAEDVRDAVIENAADLSPVVESLREALTDESAPPARVMGETLNRVFRVRPGELAPLVAPELDADDVRRRAVGLDVLGRTGSDVARRYVDDFAERLDESDERVAALALAGLSTVAEDFPGAVAEYVPRVRRYLRDEWIPDEGSGFRACYSRVEDEGDVATGEPSGTRLTNRVVRPYAEALSLVHAVALTHPAAVDPVLPRIVALVSDPPEGARLGTLLDTLTRVARADADAIESVIPAVERHAGADCPGVRTAARNLLAELGRPVERPDPVAVPDSMAARDRPVRDGDEDVTARLDQDAVRGEVDVDAVLPLLRCEDAEVRDLAAWGLECGVGTTIIDDVHDRASAFLSLLDEPHECTRKHLLGLLGAAASRYPERWIPTVAELSSHENVLVRRGAVTLLSVDAYPALTREYIPVVDERLGDDADVRAGAISVLGGLATAYPGVVAEYVPMLTTALYAETTRLSALKALRNLAEVRPNATANTDAPKAVASLVDALAGPDAIADRACWGRKSHVENVGDADQTLQAALSAAFHLAEGDPEPFEDVRPHVARVADGRYYGHREARKLLVVLDSAKRRD